MTAATSLLVRPLGGTGATDLIGRRSERRLLDQLVAALHQGQSRALVVHGESGVGKTALMEYLADRASDWRIARAAGVQSEMELAFAGLHQLCAPMLDRLEHLPAPQCDALRSAFGMSAGFGAGQIPGRAGGAEPVIGRCRGAAAAVPDR
jgi:predicted ATPase